VHAGLHLLARVHQRLPTVVVQPPQQQALDLPAGGVAMADQARRHDARVVQREKVAGSEQVGQVGNHAVGPRAPRAIDDEQARAAPDRRRLLRDQVLGQVEVEIGEAHGATPACRTRSARRPAAE
jgi:hypothetical protein